MTKKRAPAPKPKYFAEGTWSILSDRYGEKFIAVNPQLPTWRRLEILCMARANVYGHASFEGGEAELARLLPGRNGKLPDARSIRRARRQLVEYGLAAPQSTARCIVLPASEHHRPPGGKTLCTEPGHGDRRDRVWINPRAGWERETGEWFGKEVRQDSAARLEMAPHDVTKTPLRRQRQPVMPEPERVRPETTGQRYEIPEIAVTESDAENGFDPADFYGPDGLDLPAVSLPVAVPAATGTCMDCEARPDCQCLDETPHCGSHHHLLWARRPMPMIES